MKKRFTLLLIIAFIGLIASLLITKIHYRMDREGITQKSFCSVSEFIDCDTPLSSRYAKIGPIPSSELGILYYLLGLGVLLYSAASPSKRKSLLSFLFLSSLFALFHSGLLVYLSITQLHTLCLLCGVTYLVNLALFLLLPGTFGVSYRSVPLVVVDYFKTPSRVAVHLLTTAIFVGVGLVAFFGLNPKIHKTYAAVPPEEYLKNYYSLPQNTIPVGSQPSYGRPDSPITVVEFSDFQCPFCKRAGFSLKTFLKPFRNQIRFVFVNYPLDNACNPNMNFPLHPVACLTAKAGICAHQKGKFWEYHDLVFESQKKLSRDTLLHLASEVGLDKSEFEKCLIADETAALLKQDIDLGVQAGIKGTPAVFINGRSFPDWSYRERLELVIQSELGLVSGAGGSLYR